MLLPLAVWAQSAAYTTDKGWAKVTNALPANPNNYFFAFFETTKKYILGIKDGLNQSGHTTMTLKDEADPAVMREGAWMLVKGDDGKLTVTNTTYPEYYFQTEWNAGWLWRCSDNGAGNANWGVVDIMLDAGSWQLRQEMYDMYIGPWDIAFVTDNEFAGNRTQDEAPHFNLFQITRGKYVALAENLATASDKRPIDISYVITNNDASFRNMRGWTMTSSGTLSNGYIFQTQNNGGLATSHNGHFFEAWQPSGQLSDRTMSQTIQDLPKGNYRLSAITDCTVAGAFLFAGDSKLDMSQDGSIAFSVEDGDSITLGFSLEGYQGNWVKVDNFVLEYLGVEQGDVDPVQPESFEAPVVPGVNLNALSNSTPIYIYNVEGDAFVTYGMDWNTQAIATRLTNGDHAVSVPQQAYAFVSSGRVQLRLGNFNDKFISPLSANRNDVFADQNKNTRFRFQLTEDGGYVYTLQCENTSTLLDIAQARGGQLTASGGVGKTKWAFIPETSVTDGSFAAYKARLQMYALLKAIESAGLSTAYTSELNAALAVYSNASSTAKQIQKAARELFLSAGGGIAEGLDVSFLFDDADLISAENIENWTLTNLTKGWAVYEDYYKNSTLQQTASVMTGTYDVEVSALYRQADAEAAPSLVATGSTDVSVSLPIMTALDWSVLNANNENGWQYNESTQRYQPNNMRSAGQAMTSDAIVALAQNVSATDKLTIKLNMPTSWTTLQSFRIIYRGTDITALKAALADLISQANGQYGSNKQLASQLRTAINGATAANASADATVNTLQHAYYTLRMVYDEYVLRNASTSNSIDFTDKVKNPSFELGFRYWTQDGMQTQTNDGLASYKDGNIYVEKWVESTSTLASGYVSQRVSELPMGQYRLVAAAHNVNQQYTSRSCTGVSLTANINKNTSIRGNNNYTLDFTNIEDGIDLGLLIENSTGNWAAVDNFRLYYCGYNATALNTQMQNYINAATSLYSSRMHSEQLSTITSLADAASEKLSVKDVDAYPAVSYPLRKAVDEAKLSVAAYAALKTAINTAISRYSSSLAGAEAFRQAIDKALALYDRDASNEELYAMIPILERASLAFDTSHGTGAVPTITTDHRTARGAVRIFGRFDYDLHGAALKARGFVYAQHKEPTIVDGMSTREFTNNGTIYVIEGVEPGAEYYIRPFVITTGNQLAYGDELRVYTIPKGTMTWSYNNGGSAEENDRINAAIRYGMDTWNEMMSITGFHLSANYGSGTPTADCSYGGWMRIGPNASYQRTGTIMHEAAHGVGVGTCGNWWLMRDGTWIGDRGNAVLQFWDNDNNALMHGDGMHMWPYGINGAHEDSGTDQLYYGNALIIQGMGEDGLSPTSGLFAQPAHTFEQYDEEVYYIKNESEEGGRNTSFLTFDEQGNLVWREMSSGLAISNSAFKWRISFNPKTQLYQMQNMATGRFIANNGGYKLADTPSGLQMMRSRADASVGGYTGRAYWIGTPAWGTISILTANSNGSSSANNIDLGDGASLQRWFVLSQSELAQIDNLNGALIGDVNMDGRLTLADLTEFIKLLKDNPQATITTANRTLYFNNYNADVNHDGIINKADVSPLLDVLME